MLKRKGTWNKVTFFTLQDQRLVALKLVTSLKKKKKKVMDSAETIGKNA